MVTPPTGRAPLADSVLEGRHWCSYQPPPARGTFSRVSGISPGSPHRPPPRIGAAALNATDDEKIRELVIAFMGQEPGDEPRRPRTPLLAPFITHDVLLRVNNSLLRRRTTLSEGAGGCRPLPLGRAVAALTGAPRAACMEGTPGTRGNAMQARARRAVHAL